MCRGQCPGTAIDGDWRNRTEHCEVWKAVYGQLEAELLAEGVLPLTLSPRRAAIERSLLEHWSRGHASYVSQWPGHATPPEAM
jgi:uncharacterized protein